MLHAGWFFCLSVNQLELIYEDVKSFLTLTMIEIAAFNAALFQQI